MGRVSERENPFQPGAGARPPVLAGRDAELALAEGLLGSLERGRRPSEGLLLFGPRGNGKTSLLAQIAEDARGRGMRADELPASALRNPDDLRQHLQEAAGLVRTRLSGAQLGGFGLSADRAPPVRNVTHLVARWIRAHDTPLVILLDEIHAVAPDAGRMFFEAVQEATKSSLPFVLLAAGTPDAPRRIRRAGTFTERMFEHVPLGRLERHDTIRALRLPASDSGLPLAGDAGTLLADESQDYPYFIQLLGSAAWRAADEAGARDITVQSARRGIASARARIERFYAERLREARERGVEEVLIPLAGRIRERGGQIRELDLRPLLKALVARANLPGGEVRLLQTLTDLGVLWSGARGAWEMGIPSFADYLLALPGADGLLHD